MNLNKHILHVNESKEVAITNDLYCYEVLKAIFYDVALTLFAKDADS